MTQQKPKRSSRREQELSPNSASRSSKSGVPRVVFLSAIVLGLAARIVAILLAPQRAYLPDHISNMGWGDYAVEHGPWRIYELPEQQPVVVRVKDARSGRVGNAVWVNTHACNYPPLGAYLYWVQGLVWHALDPHEVTLRAPPPVAQQFGITSPVTMRVIDTRASRCADALPGVVLDFVMAWGVAALVRAMCPGRRRPLREALAFAITALAPPIFLDSAFWNQADSWIGCLLVWTLVFLLRERWVLVGVLYGAALMTKPQAILFGPVFAYVFFALRFMPGGTWGRALGMLKSAAVALVVVAFVAAPFMIADAGSDANPDGVFRWFERSYLGTIGAERYARTTLAAFNIWWLDLLAQGAPEQLADLNRLLDAEAPLLGVSKAVAGKVMLGIGVVLAWLLCARKWSWASPSWLACTFVILLAAFTLPTSVHERYVYYCVPFVIALAMHSRVWIFPMVALLLVGTFEMTSFKWLELWSGKFYTAGNPALPASAVLAILTVLSLLYSYVVLISKGQASHAAAGPRGHDAS